MGEINGDMKQHSINKKKKKERKTEKEGKRTKSRWDKQKTGKKLVYLNPTILVITLIVNEQTPN